MKQLSRLVLILILSARCFAQDITVHVVDYKIEKPVKEVVINLRVDCNNPHRPKAVQQKTDASGTTIFHSVSLTGEPICIDLFSVVYGYAPRTLDYIFVAPEQAKQFQHSLNPIVKELPAEITFHVQKRSFGEQLRFLFQGP